METEQSVVKLPDALNTNSVILAIYKIQSAKNRGATASEIEEMLGVYDGTVPSIFIRQMTLGLLEQIEKHGNGSLLTIRRESERGSARMVRTYQLSPDAYTRLDELARSEPTEIPKAEQA